MGLSGDNGVASSVSHEKLGRINAGCLRRPVFILSNSRAKERADGEQQRERDGHDVEVAGDPQHGLDLALRGGFDLVITDARAMAPGKRGMLLAEELIARLPALRERIIVATGDVRLATEETLARLGVRYVRKPFNLRDLRVAAARLWETAALS